MKVSDSRRDELKNYLSEKGIPAMIYYPVPLNEQNAFKAFVPHTLSVPVTEQLCREVVSLPIHTEMDPDVQATIIDGVRSFFAAN
jgi:dTDP-4-amino-4,6-dideoxygalactose transaminase